VAADPQELDPFAIASVAELRERYGQPSERAIVKETAELDERATAFIAASPLLVLATTGADGTCDASPKGGPPGFVHVLSPRRLLVPEFPGNRRFDGVENLVERPGVGVLFLVPTLTETLRVNGVARLTRDPALLERCAVDGKAPWFAVDVAIHQVFSHCGKAFMRSELWKPETWPAKDTVRSPSATIGTTALREGRPESAVRAEVEAEYRPGLWSVDDPA
jgi:PPOX class probable FMN-dependent enzyme